MADSYSTIALIATTEAFQERVHACAAQQGSAQPVQWAYDNRYHVASAPGWAEAVDYWLNVNGGGDGWATDQACITDGMILAQVQPMINPPPPEPVE